MKQAFLFDHKTCATLNSVTLNFLRRDNTSIHILFSSKNSSVSKLCLQSCAALQIRSLTPIINGNLTEPSLTNLILVTHGQWLIDQCRQAKKRTTECICFSYFFNKTQL